MGISIKRLLIAIVIMKIVVNIVISVYNQNNEGDNVTLRKQLLRVNVAQRIERDNQAVSPIYVGENLQKDLNLKPDELVEINGYDYIVMPEISNCNHIFDSYCAEQLREGE